MKRFLLTTIFITSVILSCRNKETASDVTVRPLKDTIGFAQYAWQMDSLMARINRAGWQKDDTSSLRFAICPHDDYTYAGKLYPELCQKIKAPNLILLGVAHAAARMGIEDSLVFDSFDEWKGPWKNVRVLPERDTIYGMLEGKYAVINDSLHITEHSIEAMIPFLQYFNPDVNIVPILVPAMSPARMEECGKALASAVSAIVEKNRWEWGRDYAIVVTTDAVHYGNEDWGGQDMAYYGCDDAGNLKALEHEKEITDTCFTGDLTPEKITKFISYTLDDKDFHKYKWTWCGRYCVPVAMYTAYNLNNGHALTGELNGYSTSITSTHVPVDDLWMGRTAIATKCHWVGYASIRYR